VKLSKNQPNCINLLSYNCPANTPESLVTEFNFTTARLQKLTNTTGRDEEYGDTAQPGLILRLTKSDSKISASKHGINKNGKWCNW